MGQKEDSQDHAGHPVAEKKHVFGVLSQDDWHIMIHDATDTATFIGFLEKVSKGCGPVLVFLDNASWHKVKAVRNLRLRVRRDQA